jgi:hypothetical protein
MSIERIDPKGTGEVSTYAAAEPETHPAWSPRERLALWFGAGLAGGLALATLSPGQWSRLGSVVFGGSARILRSPIGPALLAAILARASAPAVTVRTIDVELRPALSTGP